jgi:hypothetical protein
MSDRVPHLPPPPPGYLWTANGPGLRIDFAARQDRRPFPQAKPASLSIEPPSPPPTNEQFEAVRKLVADNAGALSETVMSAQCELAARRLEVVLEELAAGRVEIAEALINDLFWRYADLAHAASDGRRVVTRESSYWETEGETP